MSVNIERNSVTIRTAVTVPFLTIFNAHASHSSIQEPTSEDIEAGDISRQLLCSGSDVEALVSERREMNAEANWSPSIEFYLQLLRFQVREGGDIRRRKL